MTTTPHPVPSTSEAPSSRGWLPILLSGGAFFACYVIARAVLEIPAQPTALRLVVVLLPVPAFAFFLYTMVRGAREADELERRIQLEALAFAYPLVFLLLMTLGLLQRAITLKFEDWSYLHVCAFLPIFYFAGMILARKRYQ